MTATTTAATPKPKRTRKPAGPMTAAKAIDSIEKLRAKSLKTEGEILAQLNDSARARVDAFFGAE